MEDNKLPVTGNQSSHSDDQTTPQAPVSGPVYISREQNHTPQQVLPPKTTSRKLLWIGTAFLGMLLVVGVALFLWADRTTHKTSTRNTPATTSTSSPKVAAPLVTTNTPATLKPGIYTVGLGKDIVPGLYSLSPGSQQSGSFTIISPTSNYNVTLNDSATGAGYDTRVAWAQLSNGDRVQISGGNLMNVHFRAVAMSPSTSPALAKLYDNTITVTDTPNRVNPGKYLVTDTNDKNAYILVIDKNYNIKYNQPLNSTGFLEVLSDGDQVATINLTSLSLKPE